VALGSLGNIVFEVSYTDSNLSVFTFDELKRTVQLRTAKHDVIGAKSILEIIGSDANEIKFQMILSASLGIAPLQAMQQIYTALNAGTPMMFLLGGYQIGNYQWIITELEEDYRRVDNQGCVWQMNVDVTLTEFVPTIGDTVVATTITTSTTTSNTAGTTTNTGPTISGGGDGGENPQDTEDDG
jgi:phage protein U